MVKINVKLPLEYKAEHINSAVTELLPVEVSEIKEARLLKRTLNLSDKENIFYDVTLGVEFSPEREAGLLKMKKKVSPYPDYTLTLPAYSLNSPPVVVGAGPAGLFAALVLAEQGARPILLERGLAVDERKRKVDAFCTLGILDEECNIQFGEGGAGTYSDGKLKVGSMDKYKMKILSELVSSGATEDIMYSSTAHLGTDKLSEMVKKIREKIIFLGGQVIFGARVSAIKTERSAVKSVLYIKDGEEIELECENLVMATGHSAEDSMRLIINAGGLIEPRGFGIGVRIEHPREYINELVYGKKYKDSLESASYHLVTHLENGRSVYGFCMCPGGSVVAATSTEGGIVTNGMSEFMRDGRNSNAAFLVSVTPADFESSDPLAGIALQRKIERRAFSLTAGYKAPAQSLESLCLGGCSYSEVAPTYPIGTEKIPTTDYLPSYITESLKVAVSDFDSWMPGFYYPGAAVVGPETRSTSPVKVLRGESYEAVGIFGLYPCGEGAGYGGGIISSARDGVIVAEKILCKCEK